MKRQGYIQPTPATAELWSVLSEAKARQDYVEVGRLSAVIRTETIRNGQHRDSIGNSGGESDCFGVAVGMETVDGKIGNQSAS